MEVSLKVYYIQMQLELKDMQQYKYVLFMDYEYNYLCVN